MKKVLLATIILLAVIRTQSFAQAGVFDANDVIVDYNSGNPPATPPANKISKWVRTRSLSWNTDKFKSYIYNDMAFRVRYPDYYNAADTTKKYPVILFFHGGGEVAPTTDNEIQLINGAELFQDMIDDGKFNAFLVFPQQKTLGWDYSYMTRINDVMDSLQKYCHTDPDRVISMGLSAGGYGAMLYSIAFSQRVSSTIAASPALIDILTQDPASFVHIPFWLSSGGTDANPNPTVTQNFVDSFTNKGGKIRYSFFPVLGHATWDEQWDEPYLLPTWLAAHKANPLIYFNRSKFTSASAITAKIGITPGFAQYQWQKDSVDIGFTTNDIQPTQFGKYRVRFKRTATSNWSDWSPIPAVISQDNIAPSTPLNVKSMYAGRTMINLDWSNSTDNDSVTRYDVYVNGIKKYTTGESAITADNLLPNTSYIFTIKALDQAGNASNFSASLTASTTVVSNGLNYRYYEGDWNVLPNFNALTPVKTGVSANADVTKRNTGVDYMHGFVWEGYINIKTPGTYTFETSSDDGSKLYFNSFYSPLTKALVNNDGVHSAAPRSGSVSIATAGLYPIAVTYFQEWNSETMEMYWTGPGFGRSLIPDSVFLDSQVNPNDNIAPTVPQNLKVVNTGASFVDLDWDNSTDNIAVTSYDIYVDSVKKYSSSTSNIVANNLLPNTTYKFMVKALDKAGNASAFSAAITVTTSATSSSGLKYKYYEGNWSQLPDFSTLTPVKTGTTPNIDISVHTAGVNDYFGFVWEGNINITTPGSYTFETVSDDGSKFYFNTFYSPTALALINNDGLHASQSATGTVNVAAAGLYPVTITYFEGTGGESMQLYWTGPGISRQLVPNSAFMETTTPVDATAPSVPSNLRAVNTGSTSVDLAWNSSTDNVAVTGYDIYVDNVKKYSSTTASVTATGLSAGTSYSITVKALDQAGNASAFSTALVITTTTATTTGNGLKYKYYEGNWSQLPDFNSLTPVKTGVSPNIDISVRPATVNDYFGFLWEGSINITTPGTYTFETVSDDGSKFYFNTAYSATATALVNSDGLHAAQSATGTVNIAAAGVYPVAITYFEGGGGESMQLYWTGPGISRQLVPNSAFIMPVTGDVTPPTVPGNLKSFNTGNTFVTLDWDDATDNNGIMGYDIYVNNVKKYSSVESAITANNLTPNTAYTFTVKAIDQSGNASAASNAITVTTIAASSGLQYRYYQGNWNVLPNFNTLTPVKSGNTANIDIVTPRNRSDSFGFVWEGYINIPIPGTYSFETISDDGSKFYFNSFYSPTATALVSNDGIHGQTSVTGSVVIPSAGLYPIAMTFFDKTDGEAMQVYWAGPGIPRQLIPNVAFTNPSGDAVAPTSPANLKALYTSKTFVNLDWDISTDNVGVTGYDIYVNNIKKYTTTESAYTVDKLSPNTSYIFTIKAVDLAGNSSVASNAVTAATTSVVSGVNYRYYEGSWNALPNFNTLTPVKSGLTNNLDISIRTPGVNDNFAFVWEGYINFESTGNYLFELVSDDGSKFFFNSFYSTTATPLITNDGLHGATNVTGSVNVPATGLYPFSVAYFEKDGGETMQLYISGPNVPRQLLPDVAFMGMNPGLVVQNNAISLVSSASLMPEISGASDITEKTSLKAYPNPVSEWLNIDVFTASQKSNITLDMFDINGKVVYKNSFKELPSGSNTLKMNIGNGKLAPGIYFVKVNINGIPSKVIKLVKSRK